MADDLYERDFVLWTEQQAEHLRQAAREGSNLPLDWENLAEEIESLGRSDLREAESYVRQLLIHLAKLSVSPATDPRSGWVSEVGAFRFRLERILRDSPSLRRKIETGRDEIASDAVREVVRSLDQHGERVERDLVVERVRSFTLHDLLDPDFIPSSPIPAES